MDDFEAIKRLIGEPYRLPKPTPRLIRDWEMAGVIDRDTADRMRQTLLREQEDGEG